MLSATDPITQVAQGALAAHGLTLVAALMHTGGQRLTLQVLAEHPSGASPTLDECTRASRTLAAQLDVADLIQRRYTLEVSSPGLDRPLGTLADYQRFVGRQVQVAFTRPQPNAQGRAVGALAGVLQAATQQTLTIDGQAYPLTLIKGCHLHASPAELAALMEGQPLPGDVHQANSPTNPLTSH